MGFHLANPTVLSTGSCYNQKLWLRALIFLQLGGWKPWEYQSTNTMNYECESNSKLY